MEPIRPFAQDHAVGVKDSAGNTAVNVRGGLRRFFRLSPRWIGYRQTKSMGIYGRKCQGWIRGQRHGTSRIKNCGAGSLRKCCQRRAWCKLCQRPVCRRQGLYRRKRELYSLGLFWTGLLGNIRALVSWEMGHCRNGLGRRNWTTAGSSVVVKAKVRTTTTRTT